MKTKVTLLGFIILALSSQQVLGRIPGRGATTSPSGSSTSVDISNPTIGAPGTVVSAGSGANCDPRDTNGYVGLNFLRNIVDPSVSSPNELRVVEVGNNQYKVEVAKHIKACTDLQFEVTKVQNNYFVRVKNNFDFTPDNVPVGDGETFDNLSFDEKYYRCVEQKGLLKKGAFDRVKAEQVGEVSYGISSNPFSIDIGDGDKSVSVYYGSPKATGYGHPYQASSVSPKPQGWNCVVFENFNENSPERLYTSAKDRVYDRALRVCETESAEQILDELSRLKETSAGNFRDLERILEQAFEKAQDKRVEEIYARMDEIEDAMKPDADGSVISEDLAEDYAKEYSALAKELSRIVIQPSMEKVNELLSLRTNSNKDDIDKQIEALNKKVQRFSKRNFDKLGFVYDVLKEYALTDEARDIEGLRLASHFYGRVYKGKQDDRGKPMSLEDATDKVKNLISSFEDNRLKDWQAAYAVKRGSKAPIQSTVREIRSKKASMDRYHERFVKSEQENMRKYCASNMIGQMKNPVRCRSFMAGKERRQRQYMSRRSRDLMYLRSRTDQYSNYMNLFEEYQINQAQQADASDPFSFYGETGFQTDYDIYGNANDYSSDMSWMFNMGNPMSGPAQSPMFQPGMRQPASPQIFSPGFNGGMMPPPQQQGFMMQPNPYATPFN